MRIGDLRQGNRNGALPVGRRCADGDTPDRFQAVALRRRKSNDDREVPVGVALVEVTHGFAPGSPRRWCGVDIVGRHLAARGRLTIDVDPDGRLSERIGDADNGDAANPPHLILIAAEEAGENAEIGSEQLERIRALHAGRGFVDIVLAAGRIRTPRRGSMRLQPILQFGRQLTFGQAEGPFFGPRLKGRVERRVEEAAGRIGAVIGTALCRDDPFDFGIFADDVANSRHCRLALPPVRSMPAGSRGSTDCPPRGEAGIRRPAHGCRAMRSAPALRHRRERQLTRLAVTRDEALRFP